MILYYLLLIIVYSRVATIPGRLLIYRHIAMPVYTPDYY